MGNKLTRFWGKTKLWCKDHSPDFMFAGGCLAGAGAIIFAIRATRKVDPVISAFKAEVTDIHKKAEEGTIDEQEEAKELTRAYARYAFQLAKLYSPTIVCAALSFIMHHGCTDILGRRNAKLAAAYASLDAAYKAYRAEIEKKYGADEAREIAEPKEAKVDEETGEVIEEGKPEEIGDYGRLFAQGYTYAWQPDGSVNLTFLKAQQAYANQILESRGYLFLHEVYEWLGVKDSDAAHIVGWIWSEKPEHEGDNYVSFGIDNLQNPRVRAFLQGDTDEIWLDFNCQGVILGKIGLNRI